MAERAGYDQPGDGYTGCYSARTWHRLLPAETPRLYDWIYFSLLLLFLAYWNMRNLLCKRGKLFCKCW